MSVEKVVQQQAQEKSDVRVRDASLIEQEEQVQATPVLAAKGGRETSDRILYVGNLDKNISEEVVKQYFQVGGAIANVKVLVDKNNEKANYAFVEYHQARDASVAFKTLDGKQIENNVIKINWAFQSQQVSSEDTFNLFVGDLNVDVDDETLSSTFREFPTFVQAHVMWDMLSGRSRGYGFVSFGKKEEAQNAMDVKQRFILNGRALRINWASKRELQPHKQRVRSVQIGFRNNTPGHQQFYAPSSQTSMMGSSNAAGSMGMALQALPHQASPVNPQFIENLIRRASHRVTTAYIGNISHFAQEHDLILLLQNFGFIIDFKHYQKKGCCFIKYDTHEQAAVCIVSLANFPFKGRNLKTGWGKEKPNFIPNGMVFPQLMVQVQSEAMEQQSEGTTIEQQPHQELINPVNSNNVKISTKPTSQQ